MRNSETVMAEARSRSSERHVAKVPAASNGSALPVGPKTITVFLDASSSGQRRASYAVALAQRWGSHIIGMHVVFSGVKLPRSMDYARGEKAIRAVIAYEQRLNAAAEATAAVVGDHFRSLCFQFRVSGEFRPIGCNKPVEEAILAALHSDLVVIGHPEPHGLRDISPKEMLLESGGPLLILPNNWEGEAIGSRVLIGWNASRQARRAICDAMPFLVAAKSVTVLVGDSRPADIAPYLARHGAYVDVERMAPDHGPIAQVILKYAVQRATDLLVVGASSHNLLQEFFSRCATRTLLAQTSVPTLVSS